MKHMLLLILGGLVVSCTSANKHETSTREPQQEVVTGEIGKMGQSFKSITLNEDIKYNNVIHFQKKEIFIAHPNSIFNKLRGSIFGFLGLSSKLPYCTLILSDVISLNTLPGQGVDGKVSAGTFATIPGSLYGNDYSYNILDKVGQQSGNALICRKNETADIPPNQSEIESAVGDYFTFGK